MELIEIDNISTLGRCDLHTSYVFTAERLGVGGLALGSGGGSLTAVGFGHVTFGSVVQHPSHFPEVPESQRENKLSNV